MVASFEERGFLHFKLYSCSLVVLTILYLTCLFEFILCECRPHVWNAPQADFPVGKVERDGSVDSSKQHFEGGELDVEEMEAKHRNEIVDESLQVDFLAFECVESGDVVVGEEIDTERFLEEREQALVDVQIEWQGAWEVNQRHQGLLVLGAQHKSPHLYEPNKSIEEKGAEILTFRQTASRTGDLL